MKREEDSTSILRKRKTLKKKKKESLARATRVSRPTMMYPIFRDHILNHLCAKPLSRGTANPGSNREGKENVQEGSSASFHRKKRKRGDGMGIRFGLRVEYGKKSRKTYIRPSRRKGLKRPRRRKKREERRDQQLGPFEKFWMMTGPASFVMEHSDYQCLSYHTLRKLGITRFLESSRRVDHSRMFAACFFQKIP